MDWLKRNISKKMTALVIAAVATFVASRTGLDPGIVTTFLWTVATYLGGQSIVDFRKVAKEEEVAKATLLCRITDGKAA